MHPALSLAHPAAWIITLSLARPPSPLTLAPPHRYEEAKIIDFEGELMDAAKARSAPPGPGGCYDQ